MKQLQVLAHKFTSVAHVILAHMNVILSVSRESTGEKQLEINNVNIDHFNAMKRMAFFFKYHDESNTLSLFLSLLTHGFADG